MIFLKINEILKLVPRPWLNYLITQPAIKAEIVCCCGTNLLNYDNVRAATPLGHQICAFGFMGGSGRYFFIYTCEVL